MKSTIIALLIVAPLSMTLSGCVFKVGGDAEHTMSSDFEDREYENRKKISKLAIDTSFVQVEKQLGVADFTETYKNGEERIQVLYYRTHRLHKDGITTKDECTYLKFVNMALTETGNGAEYNKNSIN